MKKEAYLNFMNFTFTKCNTTLSVLNSNFLFKWGVAVYLANVVNFQKIN
jgi:hypothetical protein